MVSGEQVLQSAEKYTGVPYSQRNPQDPNFGLDCSGLVQRALSDLGITVPRTTSEQLQAAQSGGAGTNIGTNLALAQPGDVIHYLGHEEIYMGNGKAFEETTWGQPAGVHSVGGPGPIIGIVRYADSAVTTASTNGATNSQAVLTSDPVSNVTSWISSVAFRTGIIIFGAILLLLGALIMFKEDKARLIVKKAMG
jgi:hypothetical protein